MKVTNTVDCCLIAIGSFYSLANVEQMLGIIILAIQLIWIITKLTVKIVNTIKNKEPIDNINNDVKEAIDILDNFKDSISKEVNKDVEFDEQK